MNRQEENLLDKIKGLSELEFSALLRDMAEHMRREKWEHLIDDCFDIETYEEDLDEMREERNHAQNRARKAEGILAEIKDLLI